MVVATVDERGQPYQRIVLLKHYDEKGLVFYTNLGSRKAHQIENNPQVSLLFPWHMLERQVMVIGKAGVCRRWKWSNISTAVRATARLAPGSRSSRAGSQPAASSKANSSS